ncbi:hypothetical protein FOL47_005924, partial [Perkinsus chesapeaki]
IDARPSNSATGDLPEGVGWSSYTGGVLEALEEIPSGGQKWFMKLDIKAAFWNLEYDSSFETMRLFGCVVCDRNGKNPRYFLHRRLVMGWRHSSSWWSYSLQRLLSYVFGVDSEERKRIIVYIDDVLCYGYSPEETLALFNVILEVL